MPLFDHIKDRSLTHVVRFNSTPQHFRESVADHSFFVAYISSLLCRLLREKGVKIDAERATTMALVHDMEEIISGDILSPFKHHSKELNNAIRRVNRKRIKDVFDDLPKKLAAYYTALWREENEQKTIEAQLVKASDTISLLAKCHEEVKAGNEFFLKIYKFEYKNLEKIDHSWWKKIKKDVLG